MQPRFRIEWPTLALLGACYALWALGLFVLPLWLGVLAIALAVALHSSLQHEVIHGHPTRNAALNQALVWPAIGLFVPFARFRDTHLAHHDNGRLTDPYDDPESNYLDPAVWEGLAPWQQRVLMVNNTLLGRVILGPAIGQWSFMRSDWASMREDHKLRREWAGHAVSVAAVLACVLFAGMPLWAYILSAYAGFGIIKIRTFLEHQAHDRASNRTAIVEDRGPLALLFLNNNLHAVHHRHPGVPWYMLPQVFAQNRDRYLRANGGYGFPSYTAVIRTYLWRRKDPVAHPLWPPGDTSR